MKKIVGEVDGFLRFAADEMEARHRELGRYPGVWELVVGPDWGWWMDRRRGERERYGPAPDQGTSWRPENRYVRHDFVIVHADASSFRVDAVDDHGRRTWTVDERGAPEQLLPMYCHWEELPAEDQPGVFFLRAERQLWRGRRVGRLPKTWGEMTRMHWSNKEHFRDDDAAKPPAVAGTLWRPPGSPYTYELRVTGDEYVMRSHNDQGLPNYMLASGMSEPVSVAP